MRSFIASVLLGVSMLAASSVAASTISSLAAPIGPIDVSAGSFVFADVPTLFPNDSIEYIFEAIGDISVSIIGMTGNGFSNGADLALVRFGFDPSTPFTWDTITSSEPIATATGTLPGIINVTNGKFFSIFWNVGAAAGPVALRANFLVTDYVAPVPLPASGLLLIAGVGALSILRRRKKVA